MTPLAQLGWETWNPLLLDSWFVHCPLFQSLHFRPLCAPNLILTPSTLRRMEKS